MNMLMNMQSNMNKILRKCWCLTLKWLSYKYAFETKLDPSKQIKGEKREISMHNNELFMSPLFN